ncbi:helix-turn-helix domain-containing protein [Methylobacterium aquaticum]|jgi:DNA-binding XRE family transcriptional regulator|uniref:XRE family transcriptional regulator n=1 Tax=Methylobacterium aquaticum TaxID=270351 RepID=A0A0J6UNU3_9HYPH|nr:helix-turn-helix transcriptional regulator [Methylobacterium aquaticum]KMO27721.1 XRE family transcriptional regulator [Methylobacterium aquaticum]
MNIQRITTPAGDTLIVLAEADYRTLLDAAEDNADRLAVAEFRHRLTVGDEELIPAAIVDRLLAGENRVRVWREHRHLSAAVLAEQAELSQAYLSQIETGKRDGTIDTYRTIASVLNVSLDDLLG